MASTATSPQLRQLAPELWLIDHPFKVMGACLGTRSSLVRLADGGIWLLAPGPELAALKTQIDALGPITALVAPNTMHHLYLPDAARLFPTARVYGPEGLRPKQPGLDLNLPEQAPWAAELPMLLLKGFGPLEERAFYHPASRSLLLTDLVFNIQSSDHAWTRLFMSLNDGYGKFGPTRICRSLIKDKALMGQTLARLLEWDFERVVMAHGEVLERGGPQALRQAFERIGVSTPTTVLR
ncbi:MAG: hypothetical protein CVV27_04050 [Candidatus Melainabacteria bacterium HGW-Melainabacteria-1]|nr:MAG: hypothetical protein CVV27_04050 [Candidatus Melainabacteria bacterium HGW-Melainabacteria-1]